MSTAGPRKLLLAFALGTLSTLTACLPAAPPPPAAPAAGAQAGAQPAAPAAPPTTTAPPAPPPECVNGVAAASIHEATTPQQTLSVTEVALRASVVAHDALSRAAAAPTGGNATVALNVTSVDEAGRPRVSTIQVASPAAAASGATAVAGKAEADGAAVIAVEPQVRLHVDDTATDPGRPGQWAFDALDFESTWSTTTGDNLCVAILDTGVQVDHPDLAGHIAATWDATGQGVADGHGHGTHVAGIIAATPNNGIGVAGAAPGVQLMIAKVLTNQGTGSDAWTANGLVWAVDNGARVVNLSLGASCPQFDSAPCQSTAMQSAIAYAQSHDVVVVAAAGNNGDPTNPPNNPQYGYWSWPAAFSWPIAVAATTNTNTRSSFSTQGGYVDVAAPGSSILSTFKGSSYASMSGTSMATPYITALVALLRAAHPQETATQIAQRITSTATDLGDPGPDPSFGYGLADPGAAMAA